MTPADYPRPHSVYEFVCDRCGQTVQSPTAEAQCLNCGLWLEVRGHGQMEEKP